MAWGKLVSYGEFTEELVNVVRGQFFMEPARLLTISLNLAHSLRHFKAKQPMKTCRVICRDYSRRR